MPNHNLRDRILTALKQGPLESWQLVERTGGSRASISQVICKLKKEGLVERRSQFKFATFALTSEGRGFSS